MPGRRGNGDILTGEGATTAQGKVARSIGYLIAFVAGAPIAGLFLTVFVFVIAESISESNHRAAYKAQYDDDPLPDPPLIRARSEISVGPCALAGDDDARSRSASSGQTDIRPHGAVTANFSRIVSARDPPSSKSGGRRLLTYGDGMNPPRLWDASSGQAITTLADPEGFFRLPDPNLYQARFSDDGSRVFIATRSGDWGVWDTTSGESLATLREPETPAGHVIMTPNGTRVAVASSSRRDNFNGHSLPGDIVLWDVDSKTRQTVRTPFGVHEISLNDSGTRLSYRYDQRWTDHAWARAGSLGSDQGGRDELRPEPPRPTEDQFKQDQTMGQTIWIRGAAIDPTAKLTAVWSQDPQAVVRDLTAGASAWSWTGLSKQIVAASFSANGRRLAMRDAAGIVTVWDAQNRMALAKFAAPLMKVPPFSTVIYFRSVENEPTARGLAFVPFDPDGTRVITPGETWGEFAVVRNAATGLVLLRLESPRQIPPPEPPPARINDWALDPKHPQPSPIVQTPNRDKWETDPYGEFRKKLRGVASAALFSPDGKSIATMMDDGFAMIWDAATGTPLHQLDPDAYPLAMPKLSSHPMILRITPAIAAFSPDGGRLVTGDRLGRIVVWNTATGAFVRDLKVPPALVAKQLSFSPDGRLIAFRNQVWDLNTGARIGKIVLDRPNAVVGATGWTQDGRTLAVTCESGGAPTGAARQDTRQPAPERP